MRAETGLRRREEGNEGKWDNDKENIEIITRLRILIDFHVCFGLGISISSLMRKYRTASHEDITKLNIPAMNE